VKFHQHGTASESSWREQENFFDGCGSRVTALAHLHRLVAFATNCSQKQEVRLTPHGASTEKVMAMMKNLMLILILGMIMSGPALEELSRIRC
jgi:hypothetical protein